MVEIDEIFNIKDEIKKHLLTIESLTNEGFLFIEDNLVYKINNTNSYEVVLFLRTGILRVQKLKGDKPINLKFTDWNELIKFLKTI